MNIEANKFTQRINNFLATIENKVSGGLALDVPSIILALDRKEAYKYVSFPHPIVYKEEILQKYKEKVLCWGYIPTGGVSIVVQLSKFCHVKFTLTENPNEKDSFGAGAIIYCKDGQDFVSFIADNQNLEYKHEQRTAGFMH